MAKKYVPEVVTFDKVNAGDKIRKSGITYLVKNKITDNRGGYVELQGIRMQTYENFRFNGVWPASEFDKRRFHKAYEPPVTVRKE